jgi:hypothetical protein
MIEVIFTLDGQEHTEVATFDMLSEMVDFMITFKEEVLQNYPNAKNIRLGQASVGV